MSDQSPPPKPKVGSLRDRIAAFEKPNASSAPGPPPAPRPKPGGLQWKPKSPSPPPSPGLSASEHTLAPKVGGMSASDAKESIGKGGSLRERMAALQGKGAFGAPPVTAPKPAVEKPKWKPPPVISPPEEDETATSETAHDSNPSHDSLKSANIGHSASDEPTHPLSDEEHTPAAEGEEPAEADPEEEERQRRAAIAARMARLGGARVGMAPPIFGKKPPVKKVETPKEELPTQEITPVEPPLQNTPSISPPTDETSIQPSDKPDEDSPDNAFELTKSPPSSIHSPDSGSHTARIPTAMPVPAGPRRAAPPRRKAAAKTPSPAPAPVIPDEEVKESLPTTATSDSGPAVEPEPVTSDVVGIEPKETEEKIVEVNAMPSQEEIVEPIPESPEKITEETTSEETLGKERESTEALESSVPSVDPVSLPHAPDIIEDVATRPAGTEAEPEQKLSLDTPISLPTAEIPVKLSEEPADLSHELDEEAEEAARRKRVAEKLAKMGGINPFAPPPPVQRQPSTNIISDESSSQAITSAEISARVEPVARKSSVDSTTVASSPLLSQEAVKESSAVQPPSRKNSTDSTRSGGISVSRKNSQDESHPLKQPEIRKDAELGIPEEIETTYDADEKEDDSQPKQNINDEREISAVSAKQSIPRDDIEEEETPIPSEHYHEQPESPREDSTGILAAPALAPLPNLSTRPDVVPPRPALHSPRDDNDVSEPLQTPPRRSMPPPPRVIPQSPVRDEDEEAPEHFSSPRRSIPPAPQSPVVEYMKEPAPMRTLPPRPVIQSEDEQDAIESDSVALPHPHRQSKPPPPRSIPNAPDDDNGLELVSSPRRSIPPPPPVPQATSIDEKEEEEEAEVPEQEIPLPTPPRRPIPSHSEGSSEDADEEASPVPPPPVRDSVPPVQSHFEEPVPPPAEIALSDEEILDESEGDPIDPAFHSPSRKTSTAHMKLPVTDHEPEIETEEDAEQNRRKTIAERMAKLGGIRFGAVPIRPHAATPQSEEPTSETPVEEGEEQPELTEEQEEQARKQRIAAKLAGMGGMRFGMLPSGAGGMPRQQPPRASVEPVETVSSPPPPPPPSRALPPSRPPPSQSQSQETDSDYESQTTSDDGVQVEAEESELEEVSHEDAEEAPPPVPSRQGRHESVPAAPRAEHAHAHASRTPSARPPVPSTSTIPNRRSSAQPTRKESTDSNATQSPPRKSSAAAQAQQQQQQSEYVMVEDPVRSDEDEDEVPPPPPPRVTRPISRAPVREAPLPPPPPAAADDSLADSHWELPSIPTPTIDFGATTDLSLSTWSEDSTSYPAAAAAAAASPSPPPAAKPFQAVSKPLPENVNLTSEELMVVWGRVGVQICEVATALFEKSKKALIGDGTYDGFVNAVLSEVPTAAASSPPSYGYLIYVQNGSAVQKRASEIMPGDIVALFDAKLKGHKGLQIYHQNVGSAEEPLLGIVTEFEPKKSKIKVLQANQHVGQQTVESTSYRLEDLKTGIVKVFRVPEAV